VALCIFGNRFGSDASSLQCTLHVITPQILAEGDIFIQVVSENFSVTTGLENLEMFGEFDNCRGSARRNVVRKSCLLYTLGLGLDYTSVLCTVADHHGVLKVFDTY